MDTQIYQNQLDAMIQALMVESYSPPANVAREFARRRVDAIAKALLIEALFVPAAGNFPLANSNSTFTLYTRPLQRDVIVMGAALMCSDERAENGLLGEFRLRLPEPLSHLSQNYVFPAMAFAPATYSVFFPTPFVLKASEQIAIDFGWNAPQANEATITSRYEIVLFCAAVKNCLSSKDVEILQRAVRVIGDTPYQRRVLLNSWTHGSTAVTSQTDSPFASATDNMVVYDPQNVSSVAVPKGTLTNSETRVADTLLLVIGLGINSCGETVRITDTGTGHSFTQGDLIYAHNLWNPERNLVNQTRGPYFSFFRLPTPHLLRPGSTLFTEHLNSPDTEQSAFNPEYMVWECLTP